MEIQLRLAKPSDMQSILEMSKGIYDGHDYFPQVFLRWLDDPNRGIMVAEKAGTIMGLRAFHIVDNGSTVVNQSLRVHPEYRGQGVSKVLIDAANQYVQRYFPSVQTERCTIISSNVYRLVIQRNAGLDSLVLELGLVAFHVTDSCINAETSATSETYGVSSSSSSQSRSIDEVPKVVPLSFDGFQNLLKEGKLDGIIWKNTLIIDWEPFQADPSNISNGLIMDGDCLLVSLKTEGSSDTASIESLSHSRRSPRLEYQHWVATIYTLDERLMKIHIAKQLEGAILQTAKKPLIFSCFLPMSLVSCAKDYLSDTFSLKYGVNFLNGNLLLFEKDFAC